MKNETARREIESLDYYLQNHTDDYSEESHTAMMMAIKALEQEPCGDAIDRAEAIKIASGYCHPANVAKELAKLPSVNPTKTGWIPVSERLPKEKEKVLVTTVWGEVTIGERYSTIDYFINDGEINANEDEIIAWMPLPKPYEPQERSEEE